MRRIIALAAVPMLLLACADDADDADEAATVSTETGVTTDPIVPGPSEDDPDETTAGSTDQTTASTASTVPPGTTEPSDGDAPPTTLELAPPPTTVPTPPPTDGPPIGSDESLYPGQVDPGLSPFVDQAVADLAPRLGATPDQIEVISATLVTWPDSSMGCPQPGMEYLQALQDGSLIELGHDGKVYRYHSGGNRTPFLCDQPLAKPPISGGSASY